MITLLTRENSHIVSIRIPEDLKKQLDSESVKENTSFNALTCDILRKHVVWNKFSSEVGFMLVTKEFLKELLENIDDEKLKSITENICAPSIEDITTYVTGSFSLEGLTQVMDKILESSHIPFRVIVDKNEIKYIIHHNLGTKWANYFLNTASCLVTKLSSNIIMSDYNENMLSFIIAKEKGS
jgi:hypothetical protein